MLLVLVTMLASTPPTPPVERWTVRLKVDVGDLLLASWYVPPGRARIENALQQARGWLWSGREVDGLTLAYATPIVGPWLAARSTVDPLDQALLLTSGLLQTVGLGLGAARLFSEPDGSAVETGPIVAFSPIAGGRLGLSLSVTGF